MILISLLLLFISAASADCPVGYEVLGSKCIQRLDDVQLTYEEAVTHCTVNFGRLLLLPDCASFTEVAAYVDDGPTTHANDGYWLGATNSSDTHVWQWSDGSAVQMGAPYWAFDAGLGADVEPVGGPGENCAYIDPNSGWLFRDGPCSPAGTFHSVCSRTPVDGECTSQYVLVGTQCIHILTFYYHWEDARSRCALAGGDLIILDDCEQFRQIYLYLVELEDVPDGFWIGGSDLAQEGQWLWIDGSPMAMGRPYWANSGVGAPEPNNPGVENCLELSSIWMYRFSNTLCSDSRRVICETDPL